MQTYLTDTDPRLTGGPPKTVAPRTWRCLLLRWLSTLDLWEQRRRSRRQLRQLSDALLSDIGVDRERARQEADKPFWRP